MPPRHRKPSDRDRPMVAQIDRLLDRLRRDVHVDHDREKIENEVEGVVCSGIEGTALVTALVDLVMRWRLTYTGETLGMPVVGRGQSGRELDAWGVLHDGLKRLPPEVHLGERRRMARAMSAALRVIALPGRPGKGRPVLPFQIPAAVLLDVHQALVELLTEAQGTHTLPADIWHCGVDFTRRGATPIGEAAWRLMAWRIGLAWRTVRAKAQHPRALSRSFAP